jgi:DNA repair protein RadA
LKDEDMTASISNDTLDISNDDVDSKTIPTIIDDLDIQDVPGIGPTTAKKTS